MKIIRYIVAITITPILLLTLIFDVVTIFRYNETKGLWNFITD